MNWGIIGLGNMAKNFATSIRNLDDTNLLAIASNSFFKLKKFGFRYGVKNKYQFKGYENIFSCKEIDNIYISTLNNTHFELILRCIKAKKNILCEKPFTLSYEEALIIKKKLKSSNVFFMEAIAYRTHLQTSFFLEKLKGNIIGKIENIQSTFGFKTRKINNKNRLFNLSLGGGSILDLGCYPVSMSNLIANIDNRYQEIIPNLDNVSGSIFKTGVDEKANARLTYNNGITSDIKVSITDEMENKTIIKGSKGKMIIPNSWLPSAKSFVEVYNKSKSEIFTIDSKFDLLTGQIDFVNKCLKKGKLECDYPAMNWENSINCMFVLNKWKDLLLKKNESY
ncbi:MAG: putative dehydrogenase [Pelagibacterales bacterium]|nr:putative dehydrogenase [Pelagibacterales bacterium]